MGKAHAARMYAMYSKEGYLMGGSIGYSERDVEEWANEYFVSRPRGYHILEITVTPHIPATPRKEEE